MNPSRIIHLGAFDHDSYGDLLFPVLAEWRLSESRLVHVAPTGRRTAWRDARPAVAAPEIFSGSDPVDGVLLGGGDIIQDGQWWTPAWHSAQLPGPLALPALWGGAAMLACIHRAPLCWNAPGIPYPMQGAAGRLLCWAAGAACSLAVRDEKSLSLLGETGWSGCGEVVPDTAFDLSRMWPEQELLPCRMELAARAGWKVDGPYFVICCSPDFMRGKDDIVMAGKAVAAIAMQNNLTPVVLDLCPWSRPDAGAVRIGEIIKSSGIEPVIISQEISLRECTAVIANASLYIGNSLHGMVAALSYARPALAVAPKSSIISKKIIGTLAQCGLEGASHVESWDEVAPRVERLLSMRPDQWTAARDLVMTKLDAHWERTRHALAHGAPPDPDYFETLPNRSDAASRNMWTVFADLTLSGMNRLIEERQSLGEKHKAELQRLGENIRAEGQSELEKLRNAHAAVELSMRAEIEKLRAGLDDQLRHRAIMETSLSWKMTAPLRRLHDIGK